MKKLTVIKTIMKKRNLYIFVILFLSLKMFCQIPVTIVKDYKNLGISRSISGTYLKDINGDFNTFIGDWVWTSDDQKIIFKIKKITQRFFPQYSCYSDFLVADYIYTTNYGAVTVANTTLLTQNSTDPDIYPMFSVGPYTTLSKLDCSFKDVIVQKNGSGFCSATFTKVLNTIDQMTVELQNPKEGTGLMFPGDLPFNANFGLPNNITLTKQ